MGNENENSDSLLTLPVVLGVIVVLGGMLALCASVLFVYRAQVVNAETRRIQETVQAELQQAAEERVAAQRADDEPMAAPQLDLPLPTPELTYNDSASVTVTALKPGSRLQAQRPAQWDRAEIVDVLADERIKVRWLSGEPGEDVIAADLVRGDETISASLVRGEDPPTQ